jgi:hypothetical protein
MQARRRFVLEGVQASEDIAPPQSINQGIRFNQGSASYIRDAAWQVLPCLKNGAFWQ